MAQMYAQGRADFRLREDDYFNPWLGTRFAAFWIASLLDSSSTAISTWPSWSIIRGIKRAVAGMGVPYARMVEHRLRQYIRNGGLLRTWDYLWRRDREIRAEQWPWLALARRSIPIHISGESDIALTVAMSVAR